MSQEYYSNIYVGYCQENGEFLVNVSVNEQRNLAKILAEARVAGGDVISFGSSVITTNPMCHIHCLTAFVMIPKLITTGDKTSEYTKDEKETISET